MRFQTAILSKAHCNTCEWLLPRISARMQANTGVASLSMSSQKHLECGSTFKKRNMQHRALKKGVDKEVSEMTMAGIIESSFSEYVHQL